METLLESILTPAKPEMIYTVSELNLEAKLMLEGAFKTIWIMGELSNLSRPSSGHWYFSLKDSEAQIRCAFFRNHQRKLGFIPENGLQVLVQAQVSLYEARGDYQLIVRHMEVAGAGALQKAFEQLKNRLEKEGLFDEKRKKPIPTLPKTVGVITSASGAALRDILKVLRNRFPAIGVIVYPTAVQGDKAAPQIVAALKTANLRKECDVLILARGGGSLEDLWPFNEEIVARAIDQSDLPIVTGIGHEIDFTIADFVADFRAPTPSAAAEKISPDRNEWLQQLNIFNKRFTYLIQTQLRHNQLQLDGLKKRLQHPKQYLQNFSQRLDQLEHRLLMNMNHRLDRKKQQLLATSQALNTISPLATLQRGYAILQNSSTKKIIQKTSDTKKGAQLTAKLSDGEITCEVL